jgi:hypothetical protein
MPGSEKESVGREENPEAMARALELELISKRPAWQRAKARRQTWRALSVLFLLLILLGALLAYLYLVPALNRADRRRSPALQDTR